ncbi:DUF7109 family protein [Halapricum desulfuricans]|uniref:Uncharacterized protein n=1 Tax=Halapricum desulfuricans TaxID=2841257 RepID=A0A897NC21_9EURY|nr:hypothetical protein [Halapricum desulfuricans]QSG10227.1 Uncharacterized protein HSR122_2857 [Halapricum desulfuricans]
MEFTPDELAGIVDLFGALDRSALQRACVELAYKRGADREPAGFDDAIDAAVADYHLLVLDDELLVPGPIAFPELPEGATDLPHILDVESRTIDRDRLAEAAQRRFRADAAAAVEAGDRERIEHLLDVSYELEVWAPVELAQARRRLDDALGE